jgi:hypothetical protein
LAADPLRELAILVGRRKKMVDDLLQIHGMFHPKTMEGVRPEDSADGL